VLISHDRYFINRIATNVVEVGGGALVPHLGSYDDYLAAKARAPAPGAAPAPPRPPSRPPAPRPESSRRAGRATREARDARRKLEEVERRIDALEARLAEIGVALGDPALYADGERARAVTAERKAAEEQVAWLMQEWEELSAALDPNA